MSWRRATPADREGIERRLGAAPERAMFPLSNLAAHGMEGGHERAMSFWLSDAGTFGLSEEGMAMPVMEGAPDGPGLLAAIGPQKIKGVLGPAGDARAFIEAAGLSGAPAAMDDDEPQFAMRLADLRMPDTQGLTLAPCGEGDIDLLARWRLAFGIEVMGWDESRADRARDDAGRHVRGGDYRLLMRGGAPVAVTGFNARLPDIVQVGGVFVPPGHRRQGLARAAVALHLAEARLEGASRATLCAASDNAARAYRSIGFEPCGTFTMTIFREPEEIAA